MTNREKLMNELGGMSNRDFYLAFADCRTNVAMEKWQCKDCRAINGECPCPDGEGPCLLETEDWLDLECRHERLITEEDLK